MRLTQFSDLAMRVLIYAAQNPEVTLQLMT